MKDIKKEQEAADTSAPQVLGDKHAQAAEPTALPVEIIAIDSIDYAIDNHRTFMDQAKLEELAQSIRSLGVQQPIKVCRRNKRHVMIFGHRRVKASEMAGLTTVPALIAVGLTDQQIAEAQVVENIHREDIGPIGEAICVDTLVKGGNSYEQAASKLGRPTRWARDRHRLMRLHKDVQDLVQRGRLPLGYALEISKVGDDKKQADLANEAIGHYSWSSKSDLEKALKSDYLRPLDDIRKSISYYMCKMGSAYWPKDVEYAGQRPCIGCPDNTNTEPGLFDNINLTSKKGNCSNKRCYEAKAKAWDKDPVKLARDREREAARKATAKGGKAASQQKKVPDRKFPNSQEERFAVAMFMYANGLVKAIETWGRGLTGKGQELHASRVPGLVSELLHLHVTRAKTSAWGCNINLRMGNQAGLKAKDLARMLKHQDSISIMPELVTALADLGRFHNEPAYCEYSKKVRNVPLPKEVMAFLPCLEAFCQRREIIIPERPKEADFRGKIEPDEGKHFVASLSQFRPVPAKLKGKKGFVVAWFGHQRPQPVLRFYAKDYTGEDPVSFGSSASIEHATIWQTRQEAIDGYIANCFSKNKKVAKSMRAELEAGDKEGVIPLSPPRATSASRRSHFVGSEDRKVIVSGKKADALAAIKRVDLTMLQAIKTTELKGDWRRAAVTTRIKQLQTNKA